MTISILALIFIAIVAVSLYLAWKSMREVAPVKMGETDNKTLLEIIDLSAINKDLFDNLYRLALIVAPESSISFEMLWRRGVPHYFFSIPSTFLDFLKDETWYRIVPDSEDYTTYLSPTDPIYAASEFMPKETYLYPLEPTSDMSTLVDHFSTEDSLWFQITGVPVSSSWQTNGKSQLKIFKKEKFDLQTEAGLILKYVGKTLIAIFTSRPLPSFEQNSVVPVPEELDEEGRKVSDAVERKTKDDGFETKIRMVVVSSTENHAHQLLQEAATRLSEVTGQNGLNKLIKTPELVSPHGILYSYRKRYFPKEEKDTESIITTEELSRLFNWKPFLQPEEKVVPIMPEVPVIEKEKPYVPEMPIIPLPTLFEQISQEEARMESTQEIFVSSLKEEVQPTVPTLEETVRQRIEYIQGERFFKPGIHPESISGEIVFQ